MNATSPDFSRVSEAERSYITRFFETSPPDYSRGSNLTDLVDLARNVVLVLEKSNPFQALNGVNQLDDTPVTRNAMQWQIDYVSAVKHRVGEALDQKKDYYENHFLGIITKYFLKIIGMWNDGYTHAVVTAEDFLLEWDSNAPVKRAHDGGYVASCPFPAFGPLRFTNDPSEEIGPLARVNANFSLDNFYNYNTSRTISYSVQTTGVTDRFRRPSNFNLVRV